MKQPKGNSERLKFPIIYGLIIAVTTILGLPVLLWKEAPEALAVFWGLGYFGSGFFLCCTFQSLAGDILSCMSKDILHFVSFGFFFLFFCSL